MGVAEQAFQEEVGVRGGLGIGLTVSIGQGGGELEQRVVPDPGIEPCPASPSATTVKRKVPFSPVDRVNSLRP